MASSVSRRDQHQTHSRPNFIERGLPGSKGLCFGFEEPAPNSICHWLAAIEDFPDPRIGPFAAAQCDQAKLTLRVPHHRHKKPKFRTSFNPSPLVFPRNTGPV